MFPNMFQYYNIDYMDSELKIAKYINKIPYRAFYNTKFDSTTIPNELEIPANISEIGELAFSYSEITTFIFKQSPNQFVALPKAGDGTGMFDSKDGTLKNIYTDNYFIRYYDFEADNITATFYHLDGTLWE